MIIDEYSTDLSNPKILYIIFWFLYWISKTFHSDIIDFGEKWIEDKYFLWVINAIAN